MTKWKQGSKRVDSSIFKDGLLLWENSMTQLVLSRIPAFFIPKLLGYDTLGAYSIMLIIMQLFDFSSVSLWNFYSQKFASGKDINIRALFLNLVYIGILLSLFYMIITNPILNILFKGKYDMSNHIILMFIILGFLKILNVLPSSFLVGAATSMNMKKTVHLNLIGSVIQIVGVLLLGKKGLEWFLILQIIVIIWRFLTTAFVTKFFSKKKKYA